jgi:hypothetical protein
MTGSFLGSFVRYLQRRTDCPPEFHMHAGLAALSIALGNRVWCDGWARPIYPNIWVVLIAKSGFGKSVPLDMSESLVRKAGLGSNMLPDSFSQEALYTLLSKQPAAIFYLQEFSAFLASLQRPYNEGAIPWLTKIFDVPDTDTRVLRKEIITCIGRASPFSAPARLSGSPRAIRPAFSAGAFWPASCSAPVTGQAPTSVTQGRAMSGLKPDWRTTSGAWLGSPGERTCRRYGTDSTNGTVPHVSTCGETARPSLPACDREPGCWCSRPPCSSTSQLTLRTSL